MGVFAYRNILLEISAQKCLLKYYFVSVNLLEPQPPVFHLIQCSTRLDNKHVYYATLVAHFAQYIITYHC